MTSDGIMVFVPADCMNRYTTDDFVDSLLSAAGNHDRIVEKMGPVRAAEVFGRVGVTFLHPEP